MIGRGPGHSFAYPHSDYWLLLQISDCHVLIMFLGTPALFHSHLTVYFLMCRKSAQGLSLARRTPSDDIHKGRGRIRIRRTWHWGLCQSVLKPVCSPVRSISHPTCVGQHGTCSSSAINALQKFPSPPGRSLTPLISNHKHTARHSLSARIRLRLLKLRLCGASKTQGSIHVTLAAASPLAPSLSPRRGDTQFYNKPTLPSSDLALRCTFG